MAEHFPMVKAFTLEAMRARSENTHAKINENLIGTFQGIEEERTVKVDDETGRISNDSC
jgi:hypothetical protein